MAVNLGINIQRSPNRINQQLREAGVIGKYPKLLLDFADNYYLANGGSKTLANAVTHARAGNATMTDGYGPELVTNGDFSDGTTGWSTVSPSTISVSDGIAYINNTGAGYGFLKRSVTGLTAGVAYIFSFEVKLVASASAFVAGAGESLNSASGSSWDLLQTNEEHTATSAWGKQYGFFIASDSDAEIGVRNYKGSKGQNFQVRNFSVQEAPVIKWAPHNLHKHSEDLSHSDWSKGGSTTVTANHANAPDGTTTADRLEMPASGGTYIAQSATFVSGVEYTVAAFVKATSADSDFQFYQNTSGSTASSSVFTATDTWQLFTHTFTASASGSYVAGFNNGSDTYASDILVWGMHLYRSDLGGMVDNPERGDSYVPTASRPFGANLITNGTFDTDSDWNKGTNWSIGSGVASASSVSSGIQLYQSGFSLISGRAYEITFEVKNYSSGSVRPSLEGTNGTSVSANGTYKQLIVAPSSGARLFFTSTSNGTTLDVDNVTMRESSVRADTARYLPRVGHHVYNGSAWVNEGVLAESESRTNLATYSDDFSNAFWSKVSATITSDDAISPIGTESADKITATGDFTRLTFSDSGLTDNADYFVSVYAKQDSAYKFAMNFKNKANTSVSCVFDLQAGTATSDGLIEDVGNGWFRCGLSFNLGSGATTPDLRAVTYVSPASSGVNFNDEESIYIYGAQVEAASTPSSLIPTSGSTVTRAAETFTIPSANLPWPTPQYIGSELVTNGTFDTDVSGWSSWQSGTFSHNASGYVDVDNDGAAFGGIQQDFTTTVGKVYRVTAELSNNTASSNVTALARSVSPAATLNAQGIATGNASGSYDLLFVATTTTSKIAFESGDANATFSIDNVSIREINPLSVSIAMDGAITYADEDTTVQARLYQWQLDGANRIVHRIRTDGDRTGDFLGEQEENDVYDASLVADVTVAGILQSYNFAHVSGSTFIRTCANGIIGSSNVTPTALPDLSATDLNLANDYMGTISEFRVWDRDITDDGLEEATNPSLEPSLSLEFSGLGTNSFVVNDWAE